MAVLKKLPVLTPKTGFFLHIQRKMRNFARKLKKK